MALPRQFDKASAEAAENMRRDRIWIRQAAELCAGSRRELTASYDLLRRLQDEPTERSPLNRSERNHE